MADLFQKDRSDISRHINNVFKEGELDRKVVCANFAHTAQHGAIKGKTQNKELFFITSMLLFLSVIVSRVNEVCSSVNGQTKF